MVPENGFGEQRYGESLTGWYLPLNRKSDRLTSWPAFASSVTYGTYP